MLTVLKSKKSRVSHASSSLVVDSGLQTYWIMRHGSCSRIERHFVFVSSYTTGDCTGGGAKTGKRIGLPAEGEEGRARRRLAQLYGLRRRMNGVSDDRPEYTDSLHHVLRSFVPIGTSCCCVSYVCLVCRCWLQVGPVLKAKALRISCDVCTSMMAYEAVPKSGHSRLSKQLCVSVPDFNPSSLLVQLSRYTAVEFPESSHSGRQGKYSDPPASQASHPFFYFAFSFPSKL